LFDISWVQAEYCWIRDGETLAGELSVYYFTLMNPITLKHRNNGRDAFMVEENGEELAFMEVGVSENRLTVYHTEVSEKLKGEGIGMKLLEAMVDFARQHKLKVLPLCPFVHGQFKKNRKAYADIW
jgi:uncharacterized protein